jgi:hypothetical protein
MASMSESEDLDEELPVVRERASLIIVSDFV